MARYASPNKIKAHRIYTVWEAAEALGKHRQTIIRWINDQGLTADRSRKPWLIKGTDLRAFLGHQRTKAKCKLSLHHIFCLGCKSPREPAGKFADYTQQTATTGMLSGPVRPANASSTKLSGGRIWRQFGPKSRSQFSRRTQD